MTWLHPRGLLQGLAILAVAGGGLLAAVPGAPAGGAVAAVFPPWWDARRTIIAASDAGVALRLGLASFVVVVRSDDGQGRERLRQAGAWMLLDPNGLAGCGFVSPTK